MWETWRERMRHWTAQRRAAREQEVLAYPPLVLLLLLLVGSRCKPGEHNAVVHDDSGQLVHTAHLGDGIMQVLSTASGAVWTGYFDEGVFGSEGLNTHGLVRFGPDLSPQWLYPGAAGPVLPLIDDCYALNVEQERAWTYAYSDFHLVSVEGELVYDHGLVPVSGAHALLVDGSYAALIGGYAGQRHLITPLRVTPDGVQLAGPPRRLVLPDGAPVPVASYSGRGAELHVAVGATWYRLSLEDIAR